MQQLKRFTDSEFDVLASLMRLHKASASSRAMRRVLVDGESIEQAAIAERYYPHHLESQLDRAGGFLARTKQLGHLID